MGNFFLKNIFDLLVRNINQEFQIVLCLCRYILSTTLSVQIAGSWFRKTIQPFWFLVMKTSSILCSMWRDPGHCGVFSEEAIICQKMSIVAG
jgi:hypothetical protein